MLPFETRCSSFELISGIRQPNSKLMLLAEPAGLFAPEARKGQLYVVAEANDGAARGGDACQLVIKTIRKLFYDDSSYSVTSALRKAIVAANKILYEQNFGAAPAQRAVVGVTCAVVKGNDLYVAQVLPGQAFVLSGGKLRPLPATPGSATPAPIKPSSIGASLSVEPEFYRAVLSPGDALLLCSAGLGRRLGQEEAQRLLRSLDPADIADGLVAICQQNGMTDAHGLALAIAPPLSPAAQAAPLSPAGLGERGRMALRIAGSWVGRATGEAALLLRGSQARERRRRAETRIAQARREEARMGEMPEEPPYHPAPAPPPRPLDLGETLKERMAFERQERRRRLGAPARREAEQQDTRPSSFLGEGEYAPPPPERRVDLSDTPGMAALGRSYRPGAALPPIEPTLGERLAQPFNRLANGVGGALHRRRLRRPPPSALPQSRRGSGLSYRRQGPPFPWAVLLITVIVVTAAVVYGMSLSREVTQRRADDALDKATRAIAALDSADEASAPGMLDAAEVALAGVRETGTISATLENRQRYEELQREYERALASIQKLTYFDDLTEIARHPVPGGLFSSVVVPPPPQGITNTVSFESIYLLDKNQGVLYRLPRAGGAPAPMLRPGETIGPFVVGPIKDIAWREDNIIAVAQTGGSGPFIFYYRTGEQWGYNALAGSETWGRAGEHFRAVNYGGNLYVWDAGVAPEQAGQIQKYLSGNYGQFPDPWIKDSGGQKVDTALDLAIDGSIYLLKPDGHILVFEAGAFKREIEPKGINPPLSTIASFFVTGEPDSGSIFLVDFNQRIVEIDKQSGALIQQIRARPDSPLHLDQLTSLYVDASGVRPVLYLVNGGQVLRGSLPDRPRPFRAPATPGATSTTSETPKTAPTSAP